MKILIHCNQPFVFAHGGLQSQIEQTKGALDRIGVEVEFLRWWDEHQKGDVFHYFGRMPIFLLHGAKQKGMKVIFSDLMGGTGARSRNKLILQRWGTRIFQQLLPGMVVAHFNWESYRLADACLALTAWEAHLMTYIFGAPEEKVHVVPNGVEEVFFKHERAARGKWLVCTATINAVKRVVEIAEAAVLAQTPVWIIGRAYSDADPYAQKIFSLARRSPEFIRYEGAIPDRERLAQIYRDARGFVLLSAYESLSLSALEAAACECPLLLSDLPWARSTFGEHACYCPVSSPRHTAGHLRAFYDQAPLLKPPPKPLTWTEVARQLKTIYERVLSTSR
jgi:glycosyltransferase involved in cell wall biosynthesis